jgi:outer membrane protein
MSKSDNKPRKTIVAALLVLLAAGNASAQQPRKLTLGEAIEMSLQNSGKLKIANAKVEEAIAASHEARDHRLPDLKVSGSYLRLNTPTVDLKLKTGSSSGSGSGSSSGSSSLKVELNRQNTWSRRPGWMLKRTKKR